MYSRYCIPHIKEALADTPVVFVMGARQSGKTTLVQSIIDPTWEYLSFDDPAQLEIARYDPAGFIRNLPAKNIVLDEVQRFPELFVCIKQAVDEDRRPGRFLLTGSANALLLPKLSDSLAGRMEGIRLFPLSECEIHNTQPNFLTCLLAGLPRQQNRSVLEISCSTELLWGVFRNHYSVYQRDVQSYGIKNT